MKIVRKFIIVFIFLLTCFSVLIRTFGFTPYAIKTQSMEPEIPVNSLAYVSSIEFDELKTGDIITYVAEDGVTVTHRIVSIDNSERMLRLKGDNNEFPDALSVKESQVLGKVIFTIPFLGHITNLFDKIQK